MRGAEDRVVWTTTPDHPILSPNDIIPRNFIAANITEASTLYTTLPLYTNANSAPENLAFPSHPYIYASHENY